MRYVDCDIREHSQQMLDILNEAIASTTWVYDYAPRTLEDISKYLTSRRVDGFPILCALDGSGAVLGYGTFGRFRELPAYKYTVEHSVFVHAGARRRGIGRALLQRLIELARDGDYHVMLGVIDSSNYPSIAMHEVFGFSLCGTLRAVGYKHQRWLDVVMYEHVLATPQHPTEEQPTRAS